MTAGDTNVLMEAAKGKGGCERKEKKSPGRALLTENGCSSPQRILTESGFGAGQVMNLVGGMTDDRRLKCCRG